MATVKDLVEQLQRNYKPEEPIVFQYMVAEYTSFDDDTFAEIANYLMNNDSFGEESAEFFTAWMNEAEDVIETEREQEED